MGKIAVCNQCRLDIYQEMTESQESRRELEEEW
jgi:hypothetical protein